MVPQAVITCFALCPVEDNNLLTLPLVTSHLRLMTPEFPKQIARITLCGMIGSCGFIIAAPLLFQVLSAVTGFRVWAFSRALNVPVLNLLVNSVS